MAEIESVLETEKKGEAQGPKYFVCVEGTEFEWSEPTITTEEIAELGDWDSSAGVVEVDKDNNERTLAPGETVELKPGHSFGKKLTFKRGT